VASRADEHLIVHSFHHPVTHVAFISLTILALASWTVWVRMHSVRQLAAARFEPSEDLVPVARDLVPENRLFVVADTRPFAACVGLWRPAVYVSSGLLDALTPLQVRAVLAHEESHRLRRDPLRLYACRSLNRVLPTIPWVAELTDRIQLRAEIQADRYARARVKRAHLATALLELLRAQARTGVSAHEWERSASQGALTGGEEAIVPVGAWGSGEFVDERIRYLLLPVDVALPSLASGRWRDAGALSIMVVGLAHVLSFRATIVVALQNTLALLPAAPTLLGVILHL